MLLWCYLITKRSDAGSAEGRGGLAAAAHALRAGAGGNQETDCTGKLDSTGAIMPSASAQILY